jgi:hypothetical protein
MTLRLHDCVLPPHPPCLRGCDEIDWESAVGALEWFVKVRESRGFLCEGFLLPTLATLVVGS